MRAIRAAAAAALLHACSGDDITGPGGAVVSLEIQPAQVHTLTAFGQTVQLLAVAHNRFGRPISDPDVEWTSRDPAAATVEDGLVTARGDGSTFIVAVSGDAADSVQVVVERPVGVPTVAMVSGDGQSGRAGQELAQPFVVRVTNARGEPVPGHQVFWDLASGDGLVDGRRLQNVCSDPPPRHTPTDEEGFAQVSFTPTWFGPSTVAAYVVGNPETPVLFSADASDAGATITIVSGTPQQGRSGETVSGSLRARVTDGHGNPAPQIPVTWRVISGSGDLGPWECEFPLVEGQTTTRTGVEGEVREEPGGTIDLHGVASVRFTPTEVGHSIVVASIGLPTVPLTTPLAAFQIEVTSTVLQLHQGFERFFGPDPAWQHVRLIDTLRVPVGTAVEWFVYSPDGARIVSTTAPAGGVAFDSGVVPEGDSFTFVPGVAGAWDIVDQIGGATLTLIAE